ncbi:diaminopimelate dehydrogenase [Flavonifractor plautii]|uniref:diaminopimelate dehydrogenase n=1 Tax=Flavonifractor plautii TaxID=292800 RepID=UPI0012AB3755|nr:diaminopimelate dehydrogenase [Flavonifractor plautii]
MDQIRIGIVGYGNLGRGVEYALRQNPDMALVGVFTRRPPSSLTLQTPGVPVYPLDALDGMEGAVDVLLLCGGSAADLPEQSPRYAGRFHLVDSFDTHANIPAHFAAVDAAARAGGKTAIISAGWDPGLFSLVRALAAAVLPCGESYTFWGRGVSQGHSDAVRRIPGVRDARQYTIPIPAALDAVRSGANPALTTRQKHMRECFVVAEEGADRARIEQAIITMPHYFADYDTTVHFLSEEELLRDHGGLPHGGFVFRGGRTGRQEQNRALVEFRLTLDSNPEFTACVLTAFARAAFRLGRAGQAGCKTVFDIPPAALSPLSPEELRRQLL